MNLYFLVEGAQTEKQVYRAWVEHLLPQLHPVQTPEEILADHFCIISGGGMPQTFQEIQAAFKHVRDNPAIDHLFICVDAENEPLEAVLAEIEEEARKQEVATAARNGNPTFSFHVIVQHCCIETWFLGNRRIVRRNPESERLRRLKTSYDVSVDDPELMACGDGHSRRAAFHLEYLREVFREQGLTYSKKKPGDVLQRHYLDALRERCDETLHLRSLERLFSIWRAF